MSASRTTAILAAVAGAALVAALAALLLRGDPPDPATAPAPVEPEKAEAHAVEPADPPTTKSTKPGRSRAPEEDDRPPTPEKRDIPAGWKSWARLRLLDAKTREAIPLGRGGVYLVQVGGARVTVPEPFRLAPDGRVEIFRSEDERELPEGPERAAHAAAAVEIRIPGRVPRRFASREALAREPDVEMAEATPSVRGTIRVARGLERRRIHMDLQPTGSAPDPRRPDVMPSGGANVPGPFTWYDVPDGDWRLVAWLDIEEGVVARAVRDFTRSGAEVDLGEITIHPPSTLRARVVARNGDGVLDKGITLRRADRYEITAETSDDLEDGGWVIFRSLDADVEYTVVSTLDGLNQSVRTPVDGGGELRVELPWENEGVHCRLRFTVDGQDPIQWGDIVEGPTLDKGAWRKDGTLEHDMAAGEYFFMILARPVGKDAPVRVVGKFTVPEQHLWDATIDFKEPK